MGINLPVFVVSTILPDVDFFIFVPFLGKVKGHRTITHSLFFQFVLAVIFKRFGFWSVFGGLFFHSFVDNFIGKPPGIAWLWPIKWERF